MPELKPVNLGKNELLYQQGETAEEIYFIHSGQIKLWIDANDSIHDEELLRRILEKQAKEQLSLDVDKELYEYKPSIKAIVQYTEGGYFGDTEIFAKVAGIYPDHAGREASAIGH